MTRKITMMLAAVLCLASCQDQQGQYEPQRAQGAVKFHIGMEGVESKAAYSGAVYGGVERIDWKAGDAIGIYCDAAKEDKYAVYTVSEVSESSSAVSTAVVEAAGKELVWGTEDHVFYSCYPEKTKGGIVTELEKNKVSAFLATKQGVSGTIEKSGTEWKVAPDMKNMLMVSKSGTYSPGDDVTLNFTALTTALQFTVTNDTGAELKLVSVSLISGNHKESAPAISGAFTVNLDSWSKPEFTLGGKTITYANDYPEISTTSPTTNDEKERTVMIEVGTKEKPLTLAKDEKCTFTFFVIPTADFDDLTFKFTKSDESWMSTKLGYTDGSSLLFPKFMKSKVDGILLPNGAQWTVKYGPAGADAADAVTVVTSWNTGVKDDLELKSEYVDLGLSVLWATCNVGATKPEEYGDYFAWGATEPWYEPGYAQSPAGHWKPGKEGGYTWANTPYQTNPDAVKAEHNGNTKWLKYLSGGTTQKDPSATDEDAAKSVLDLEDDAAHVNWGGSWRMPTKDEWDELIKNTNRTKTTFNGVNVYKITSKKTGYTDKFIYIPLAGWFSPSTPDTFSQGGSYAYYWSSTQCGSSQVTYAYELYAPSTINNHYRCCGQPVRAVKDKEPAD